MTDQDRIRIKRSQYKNHNLNFPVLTVQSIIDMSQPIHKLNYAAIYYLLDVGVVVYVGQSRNVMSRIGVHIAKRVKVFDTYYIIPIERVNNRELNELETLEIIRHNPKYNRELPINNTYATRNQLKRRCHCNMWTINRHIKTNSIKSISACNLTFYLIEDFAKLIEDNKPELVL